MKLRYLPDEGDAPWRDGVSYQIHDSVWVGDMTIVLGREKFNGRERTDYFVAVYESDGRRWPGSGVRTTPDLTRAKEIFDAYIEGRRRELRGRKRAPRDAA